MTIPLRDTRLQARTDADFTRRFARYADAAQTEPFDLSGWTLRFVVKRYANDEDDWIAVENASIARDGHEFTVSIDRAVLLAALASTELRTVGEYALQASGPGGADEVWLAGKFELRRGL